MSTRRACAWVVDANPPIAVEEACLCMGRRRRGTVCVDDQVLCQVLDGAPLRSRPPSARPAPCRSCRDPAPECASLPGGPPPCRCHAREVQVGQGGGASGREAMATAGWRPLRDGVLGLGLVSSDVSAPGGHGGAKAGTRLAAGGVHGGRRLGLAHSAVGRRCLPVVGVATLPLNAPPCWRPTPQALQRQGGGGRAGWRCERRGGNRNGRVATPPAATRRQRQCGGRPIRPTPRGGRFERPA